MLEKLKNVLSFIQSHISVFLGASVGLLLYYLQLKHKEVNALRAQVDLVDTQKKADILETQIQNKLSDADLSQKEIDEHNKTLAALTEQRKNLPEDDKNPEDYWKKN